MTPAARLAFRLSPALLVAGCWLPTPGLNEKLDLQAVVDDQIGGGWAVLAIAPGTAVSVRVLEHDTQEVRPVTEWMVDNPSVVAAEREERGTLRLLGLVPGSSLVRVRSGIVEDAIRVDVAPAVSSTVLAPLSASKKDERALVALAGQEGELPIFQHGPGGESVLALGVAPPVGLDPESVARVLVPGPRSGARLHLAFDTPGRVAITSGRGPGLEVEVVAAERVDALLVEPPTERSSDRSQMTYVVRVVVGGRKSLLVSSGFRVEIETPNICAAATGATELETKRLFGMGAFSLQAINGGACEGVVRLGAQHDRFSVDLAPASVTPPATPAAPG